MAVLKIIKKLYRQLPTPLIAVVERQRQQYASRKVGTAFKAAGIDNLDANDFNNLLHYLRTQELQQLPKAAPHFISVGCAGTWYFEWIEKCCGPIKLHTGIEFYSPEPDKLPAGVAWIANTAGDMSSIESNVGDVLFSGQNIEHLWPADVTAFLRESWRVLKPGGLLVIDSPNRSVTAKALWSHPEHTIELTPEEARILVEASGFEVTAVRGVWLCADPESKHPMQIGELTQAGSWPLKRRISSAASHPNESFCWWLEARKRERAPDSEKGNSVVAEIFQKAWPERTNRFLTQAGENEMHDGRAWMRSIGKKGALLYGPFMPLPIGNYSVTFEVRSLSLANQTIGNHARLEVIDVNNNQIAIHELSAERFTAATASRFTLHFELNDMVFGIQFRVMVNRSALMAVRAAVNLISHTTRNFSVRALDENNAA